MKYQPLLDQIGKNPDVIEELRYLVIGEFDNGMIPENLVEQLVSALTDDDDRLALLLGFIKLHEKWLTMRAAVSLQHHSELWSALDDCGMRKLKLTELLNYSDDPSSEISRLLAMIHNRDWDSVDFFARRNKIADARSAQHDRIYDEADTAKDRMRRRYRFEDDEYTEMYVELVGEEELDLYAPHESE